MNPTPEAQIQRPFTDAFLSASPIRRVVFTRGVPTVLSIVLILILMFSRVGVKLWIIQEPISTVVVIAYIAILARAAWDPTQARYHRIGSALAVLVFGGRAGGFIDIMFNSIAEPHPELGFREDLSGAVSERLLIMLLVIIWHTWMVWRATALNLTQKALQNVEPNPDPGGG